MNSIHRRILLLSIFLLLLSTSCAPNPHPERLHGGPSLRDDSDKVIIIPCRTCIVEGSDISVLNASDRDAAIQDVYNSMNQNIWNQASIVFLGCCQEIPVIDDPDVAFGHKGDIAMGTTSILPSSEMVNAYTACAAKWAEKQGHFIDGPIVIIAREVKGIRGSYVEDLGITSPAPKASTVLCQFPRALTADDVKGRYSIVTEQARFGPRGDQKNVGNLRDVLAHEFGHQLLLAHGNGMDDDRNGAKPPTVGPRLFDSQCDPAESGGSEAHSGSQSLMGAQFGDTSLSALQIELARDAAKVWPGHVGP